MFNFNRNSSEDKVNKMDKKLVKVRPSKAEWDITKIDNGFVLIATTYYKHADGWEGKKRGAHVERHFLDEEEARIWLSIWLSKELHSEYLTKEYL